MVTKCARILTATGSRAGKNACRKSFRASFHGLETTAAPDGITPAELTVPVTRHLVAMRGSDRSTPRCVALAGDIGHSVRCTIYERRASPCRDFPYSWADGVHNERCDRARAAHGLPPLPAPVVAPSVEAALVAAAAVEPAEPMSLPG